MKKLFLILLSVLLSIGAWAASVNDLVAIDHDWVFIADDITSNGSEGLTANTLYADGKIFTPTNNDKANNTGKSTIESAEHLNSLRLKYVQDRLAFKVSGPCSVTFYTQNHSSRGINISKVDRTQDTDPYWKQQPASTPRWEVKLDEAGVYYLSNYGGDFYFAGFEVIMDPIAGSQVFGIKRDVAEETSTSSDSKVTDSYAVSDDVLVDPSVAGVTMAKNFGTQSVMTDKARRITWQNDSTTVNCYVDKDVKNYRTLIDNTSVTAIDDNCYFGFDLVVEAGYKASLNRLVSDVMKTNSASHYQVKIYNNGELVKTLADIEATSTNTDMKRNVDLSQDAALQNMTGTITVKMFIWNTNNTQYIIVKDLYVNAVVEEIDPVDPALIKTFGAERANDATIYTKIDPAVTGITVGNLTSNYAANGAGDVYHGSASPVNFAAVFRNIANDKAIKTQNGVEDGAETNNAAIYFDLTAATGYKMRITNISSDFYTANKTTNYYYEYIIENEGGDILYKSPEPLFVYYNVASDKFDYSVNLKAVESLKNLTGTIRVKFVFWVNSGSTNIALKNLKVQAVIEEPEPEPESTWQDISIDLAANAPLGQAAGAKYLTIADEAYAYVDEEPASYNAYLSSTGWNGSQHGYDNITMAVPVATGIYKITFGGCNFGSENRGKVTDAEGNTLNVINANGKTITTIDNKVGCSNTVSVWYEAASAMVLKAIMNNYIPSIAIEKVSSVPENRNIITYSLGEGVLGQAPDGAVAEGNSYTLPTKNYTVYKEGYTLTGWNDGTANHNLGETFTVDDDITLTPVFRQNTKTLADRTEAIVLKWDAQTQNGCPTYNYSGNNLDLYFVTQVTVDGEVIDVAEKVTTASSNGCFRNGSWANWCQVNGTAIFVLPSCKNAIVTFESYSASANSTIDGVALIGNTSKTPSATIADEDATVTVEYAADASYFRYMQVTLPKQVVLSDQMTAEAMAALNGFTGDVTVNRLLTAGMFNTICLPFAMSADKISAKLGTCDIRELSSATLDDNELVLNFTSASTIVAGKAYLINPTATVSSWTMENVTLSTTTNPSTTASVDFIGVLTPTELAASENTLCVGSSNTLFYVNSTSTMKGLRAYFQVKGAAAGAPARISLGGHVATGLENDNESANVNKCIEQGRVIIRIDGHDYDLNGRMIR